MQRLTDKQLNKYFGHREDHQYRHFNRSIGCFVEGKEHFKKLLAQKKLIPYDLAEKYAEEHDYKRQPYELSTKAKDIIKSVKLSADKHGNIKLGGRAIQALKEIGAIPSETIQRQMDTICKEGTPTKGGFSKDNETFSVQRRG